MRTVLSHDCEVLSGVAEGRLAFGVELGLASGTMSAFLPHCSEGAAYQYAQSAAMGAIMPPARTIER